MKLRLLAVGTKMPAWVQQGFNEYAKRLPADCALELVEISAGHRTKSTNAAQAMKQEADALRKALKPQDHVVALDVTGQSWSTERLAENLSDWRMSGQNIAFLIGGPDGLTSEILSLAKQRWSLSKLTFPHPLVRVIMAEQLYRAWTLLQGHPYHK